MVGKKYLDTELRQGRMESGQEIFFTDKQQIYCVAKGTPAFSSDQQCPKGWTSTTSPGKWRNLCVNPETVVRYPKELDGTCISKFKEDPNNKNQCLLDQENVKLSKGDAGLTCTPGGKKFLRVDQDLIYFGNLSCKLNGAEFTSDQVACKFKEGATVWSDCWSQVAMLTESDVFETGSGGIKIDINKGAATK